MAIVAVNVWEKVFTTERTKSLRFIHGESLNGGREEGPIDPDTVKVYFNYFLVFIVTVYPLIASFLFENITFLNIST